MTRGSALTILATTRSAEFANRIGGMLAKIEDVRVDTRIGDLPALAGGEAGEALDRADVLLVDIDPDDERELRQLGRIIEQRLSPQYVSIHATDVDVRAHLLGVDKKRADISKNLARLLDAGIEIHSAPPRSRIPGACRNTPFESPDTRRADIRLRS